MSSRDVSCPYCNQWQEICHDDGFGYEEDVRHEMQCSYCDKSFVFTTSISFHYEASRADCLNGSPHQMVESVTYPKRYTKMQCKHCEYTEPLPSNHPYLQEPPNEAE